MNTQDSGGAAGRKTAPEGKDPDGPGPGGASAKGKDGWEGGGGDAGEEEKGRGQDEDGPPDGLRGGERGKELRDPMHTRYL